jgi:hypothetical protein
MIAMAITTILFCFGQSIVTTDKQWNNLIYYNPSKIGTEHIKFTSDTVINSLTYKKVERALDEYEQIWEPYGYIRENQDKKVYYKINPGDTEWMLYDLNALVHDTIYASELVTYGNNKYMDSMPYYVHYYDSILIDQTYRKRINLALLDDTSFVFEQWIDGIGSLDGMLHNRSIGVGCDSYSLLCYFENGILKYKNPDLQFCHYWPTGTNENTETDPAVTIFPHPVTDISVMDIKGIENFNRVTVKFYNLFGNEVLSEKAKKNIEIQKGKMPSGLYFYRISVDGRLVQTGKLIIQ